MENENTTEVVKAPSKEVAATLPWSRDQIELIKTTVARGATDDELKLFLYTSQRTGLDPLTKQIHFVKRWDNRLRKGVGAIQTGIDGYRAIAERTGSLAGIDDAVYEVNAETQKPSKATVTVHRFVNGQRVSFTASARWNEYVPLNKEGGVSSPLWNKMPFLMLGKCAEALALRKAFPNDLSGVYTTEEMQQADVEAVAAPAKPVVPSIKNQIYEKLLALRPDVGPANVREVAKELTGQELVEANYTEINERLGVLLAERNQHG